MPRSVLVGAHYKYVRCVWIFIHLSSFNCKKNYFRQFTKFLFIVYIQNRIRLYKSLFASSDVNTIHFSGGSGKDGYNTVTSSCGRSGVTAECRSLLRIDKLRLYNRQVGGGDYSAGDETAQVTFSSRYVTVYTIEKPVTDPLIARLTNWDTDSSRNLSNRPTNGLLLLLGSSFFILRSKLRKVIRTFRL